MTYLWPVCLSLQVVDLVVLRQGLNLSDIVDVGWIRIKGQLEVYGRGF